MNYLVGVGVLFLVGTRGAVLPEVCLRLEADRGESG